MRGVANAELSNVTDLHWRDGRACWFAGWDELGSIYGVVALDGTIEWSEHEDAVVGDSAFVARVTPAPDGNGLAAIRETVGASRRDLLPARAAGAVVAGQRAQRRGRQGLSGLSRDHADRVEGQGRPRAGGRADPARRATRAGRCRRSSISMAAPATPTKPQFNPSGALRPRGARLCGVPAELSRQCRLGAGLHEAQYRRSRRAASATTSLPASTIASPQGWIDADRLGVTGGSYGGYMTGLGGRDHQPVQGGDHGVRHRQPDRAATIPASTTSTSSSTAARSPTRRTSRWPIDRSPLLPARQADDADADDPWPRGSLHAARPGAGVLRRAASSAACHAETGGLSRRGPRRAGSATHRRDVLRGASSPGSTATCGRSATGAGLMGEGGLLRFILKRLAGRDPAPASSSRSSSSRW